jgi:RNA polymerase sigma factor (sigma-70 family)
VASGSKPDAPAHGAAFPVTSWSLICQLKDSQTGDRDRHLERLLGLYWAPVFCVIRHGWAKTDADAKDLTQEFFLSVVLEGTLMKNFAPDRGSFRAFLRGAITNFMRDEIKAQTRQKRGGGMRPISLDDDGVDLGKLVPDAEGLSPEQVFDAAWTRIVLARALKVLEQRLRADGREPALEAFRRYDLGASGAASYREIGEDLGLSPDQVKHALAEARDTFRDIVTSIVRGYVDGPEELVREMRHLLGA